MGQAVQEDFLDSWTFEDRKDRYSLKVGKKLPSYAAYVKSQKSTDLIYTAAVAGYHTKNPSLGLKQGQEKRSDRRRDRGANTKSGSEVNDWNVAWIKWF